MYKSGDHVFYPKGGVFIVEEESEMKIAGMNIPFYNLRSNDGKTRIIIPKSNVSRVGVRRLISPIELEAFFNDWVPDRKLSKLHHKNRKSRFETLRQTGTFHDMSVVAVTIHYLIDKTKATFEEKRMYDQIRKRIINEIEIVKGWVQTKADGMLQDALDTAIKRKSPTVTMPEIEEEALVVDA